MKKFQFLAMILVMTALASFALAGVPRTINYQGYLKDSSGVPANGTVNIAFKLYNVASGGSPLWTETQSGVAVSNGIYQATLGSVTPLALSFDSQYYLGVTVAGDPEMSPRQSLTSVPYALNSVLPASTTVSNPLSAFSVTNNGDGSAGRFYTTSSTSQQLSTLFTASNGGNSAFEALQAGSSGSAGYFSATSPDNLNSVIYATGNGGGSTLTSTANGTGMAGSFNQTNPANSQLTLYVSNQGNGGVIYGTSFGNGTSPVADLSVINAAGGQSVLKASTNGTGKAGEFRISNTNSSSPAVYVSQAGRGNALEVATSGADANAASFTVNNASNPYNALYAYHTGSGAAIQGNNSGTGIAGDFNVVNVSGGQSALKATTSGTGKAAEFRVANSASSSPALYAEHNGSGHGIFGLNIGTGPAAAFVILNPGNNKAAVTGTTNGTGRAGDFSITNSSSTNQVLYVSQAGSGNALEASNNGSSGAAGRFVVNNVANSSAAVAAYTIANAAAILGQNAGAVGSAAEFSVDQVTNNSHAVVSYNYGQGQAGSFNISNATNGNTVLTARTNGFGGAIYGASTSGVGVQSLTGNNFAVYGVNTSTDYPSVGWWNQQGSGYIYTGWSGAGRSLKFSVANNGDTTIAGKITATTGVITGANNWDLNASEGDFKVGNGTYRLKIGVPTAGGGAGDIAIKADGGLSHLSFIAAGGTGIYSNTARSAGVTLAAGGSAWAAVSDRNMKQDIVEIDTASILSKLSTMPVYSWQYKTEISGARHIGPMAQDFYAAFGLGDSDKTITTVDADGVALAAIKALKAENETLKNELGVMKNRLDRLEQLLH